LDTFSIEISSFLKELKSPYRFLYEDMNEGDRFLDKKNKLILLNYLSSELEAATMMAAQSSPNNQEFKHENNSAESLKTLLIALGFPKPPANITFTQIWTKVEARINELLAKLSKDYLSKPIIKENKQLTQKQWNSLIRINNILNEDFKSRRELLMKRLEVTVQSFKWSDQLKNKNDEINKIFQEKKKELDKLRLYNISMADFLAAREDVTQQEKTCSTRLIAHTKLHKVIIANVPDRGGRTSELEPPPPEMPAFQKRQQSANYHPAPQRERVQSGRGGRGGRAQGGWSQQGRSDYKYDDRHGSATGTFRPQSDFEKFTNTNYNDHYQDGPKPKRGGGRGGRGSGRY
jgi:protein FAM98B